MGSNSDKKTDNSKERFEQNEDLDCPDTKDNESCKRKKDKIINQTDESKVFQKSNSNISVEEIGLESNQSDCEDTKSVGKQESCCSEKSDKGTTVDLSLG